MQFFFEAAKQFDVLFILKWAGFNFITLLTVAVWSE